MDKYRERNGRRDRSFSWDRFRTEDKAVYWVMRSRGNRISQLVTFELLHDALYGRKWAAKMLREARAALRDA